MKQCISTRALGFESRLCQYDFRHLSTPAPQLLYDWIFTLPVFSATMNIRKKLTSIFPWRFQETYVTYEPAAPAAVLITALLCIWKQIFHSQNGTILTKYKYKDWILLVCFSWRYERHMIYVEILKSASCITKFTRGPSVIHTSMRNKQVEFNSLKYYNATSYDPIHIHVQGDPQYGWPHTRQCHCPRNPTRTADPPLPRFCHCTRSQINRTTIVLSWLLLRPWDQGWIQDFG